MWASWQCFYLCSISWCWDGLLHYAWVRNIVLLIKVLSLSMDYLYRFVVLPSVRVIPVFVFLLVTLQLLSKHLPGGLYPFFKSLFGFMFIQSCSVRTAIKHNEPGNGLTLSGFPCSSVAGHRNAEFEYFWQDRAHFVLLRCC